MLYLKPPEDAAETVHFAFRQAVSAFRKELDGARREHFCLETPKFR